MGLELKRRIDLLLVERGLAPTRHKAQAMIIAGQVLVDGQKAVKPGQAVPDEASIRILGVQRYASRGGGKLEAALDRFEIDVAGRICADLGASTGGFTDCLLQRGAREVHAFDVGKGQLDWRLRSDRRVVVRDRFNVRYITGADLPPGVSLVTVDLSFISLTKVLAPLYAALRQVQEADRDAAPAGPIHIILLVKPQFEVGKGEVRKGGIVRDPAKRAAALASVESFALGAGYRVLGSIASPVAGAEGNQEFLLYLQLPPGLSSPA
ncbi:MAG: TlyA family RNA methyltransferase [Acidobacteria bacterium]|nr:TlyA family RNA methyltransferase [Acidobacteriota bacterium]